ncbi:hypothetical protein [Bradyrhizobium genosp. P]|uniref:hypothetical protein n=1 Tax=Bradyrhizobium genosp. P TaxID=83641 RepID=UPI003CF1A051
MLADAVTPVKRFRLSGTQKATLYAAFAGRLQLYPRGYAASKSGPFHSRRAVLGLARAGLVSISATARYATATKRARDAYADPTRDGASGPADAQTAKPGTGGRPDGGSRAAPE